MAEPTEPRALSAALSGPVFTTRVGGAAVHAANRHVERWAPETGAGQVRSMRSLGFVDRLVAPWMETAQRSAGLRMFSGYGSMGTSGMRERDAGSVSWVFPRPWFQDELDWMAASREASVASAGARPTMLTTRGTYVPSQTVASPAVLPSALYEYVAPSLSIAQTSPSGSADAYSPLVSLAAVQAAEMMSRSLAPLVAPATPSGSSAAAPSLGRVTPALRTILATMLERASGPDVTPTRASYQAPELVTPPAPRDERFEASPAMTMAEQVAVDLGEQRAQVARLQAIAQRSTEREIAATRAVDVQAHAQRVEAELRQRTAPSAQSAPAAPTTTTPTIPASVIERATAAAVADRVASEERARIEERVAQRIAERVATQQLHEQVRREAAVHARGLVEHERRPEPVAPVDIRPPAEVLAAISSLPPALAGMLSHGVMQRPGGVVQAISEINEALRTAELLARSAAVNATFEPTRGPRLMMPAGLGGLVAAVDRAHAAPAMATAALPAAPRDARMHRVPTLPWIAPAPMAMRALPTYAPSSPAAMAPTTALGATAGAAPAALAHVAWADRWLARFAGASTKSLDVMDVASAASPAAMRAHLATIAPEAVFLAPMFDVDQVRTPSPFAPSIAASGAAVDRPLPRLLEAPPPPMQRFDDNAETPDDVFASIAASSTRNRAQQLKQAQQTPAQIEAQVAAQAAAQAAYVERPTYADYVAQAAPSAPDAGLGAQLAASPFAPALRHILALPSAQSFDVRALFGGALSSTYLAGLLAPESHELEVASPMPAWASWSPALASSFDAQGNERFVPELDFAYVAPELEGMDAQEIARAIEAAEAVAGMPAMAPSAASAGPVADLAPLLTLRTALLSWTAELGPDHAAIAGTFAPSAAITSAGMISPQARAMIEAMTLPMLDETEPESLGAWTAPGAIADRAFGYSIAQERSSADLSFDFVPPELVLAARVYGLGPAEAAQAARLALAGPGQLSAMAGAVDRTFVQAMAIEAERRENGGRAIATAYPAPASLATASPATGAAGGAPEIAAYVAPSVRAALGLEPGVSSHSAFGVDRRVPRGAFLWPSAAVAALGLTASSPDGEQSMPVAALELLAAQAVAEIGTFAAFDDHFDAADRGAIQTPAAPGTVTALPTAHAGAPAAAGAVEPSEADVLGAASALVASSRRARFDALYVALSQSPSGASWSPAARAARALALAGRSEDGPTSAYERAAAVWDVLPVVYATEGMSTEDAVETQAALRTESARGAAARERLRRPGVQMSEEMINVDGRPGLSGLSSRAGEALGSYITQVSTPSLVTGGSAPTREPSVIQRAPTAAQELVQTGRPSGRHGGGEAEIPPWFEAAARKMLGERMGAETVSLAELTLVTAAPAAQIAASSKTATHAAAPLSAGTGGGGGEKKDDMDVDQIADEVYRQIMIMMDAARARNGEPYL